MEPIYVTALSCAMLICSLALNGILFQTLKRSRKKPSPTQTAQDVMRAFMNGGGIFDISVRDPGDFFLRSPRG